MRAKRDGGLDSLEVHGIVTLNISDEKYGLIKIKMGCDDDKGVQSQVKKFKVIPKYSINLFIFVLSLIDLYIVLDPSEH